MMHKADNQPRAKGAKNMTLSEAVQYFTGDAFTPSIKSPKWSELANRIDNVQYTPEEFCYFCVHYLLEKYDPSVLMKINLIACQKTWDAFLQFKKERAEEIENTVRRQRKEYVKLKQALSPDLILIDDRNGFNPVVRCDLAAKDFPATEVYDKIIDRYGEEAEYILTGNPEYNKHIKHYRI